MADELRKAEYDLKLIVEELIDLGQSDNNEIVTWEFSDNAGVLRPTTTVPATKVWRSTVTLTAGGLVVDLTSLSRTGLTPAISFSGLKVQLAYFAAPTTNSDFVQILPGATNAYSLFGTSHLLALSPGQKNLIYKPDNGEEVSSTVKNFRFASNDLDATMNVLLVAG